jgi:ABC-type glycerol-3-phosphate transport system substrate-binding protein
MISFLILNTCSVYTDVSVEPIPETGYTLKIVTPSAQSVKAIYEIAGLFSRNYPVAATEISVISGGIPINAFLTSKFAVGDVPDILIYQAGSGIELFAQGGHLLDLSDSDFEGRFSPEAEAICRYGSRLYALPLDITISGLFVQMSVLWQGAVRNSVVRIIPKTFDEFIISCAQLRSAGINYPVVIGASGDTGAVIFLYQYMHQYLYAENPRIYEEILKGKRKWTDREFQEMYRAYGQIREYVNPDAPRIGEVEAMRRFAGGEAAYYIGQSRDIAAIRRFKQPLDMVMVTPPWGNESQGIPLVGVDTVVSISADTWYPDEAKAFLRELTSVYGADIYSQEAGSISATAGSSMWYDFCLGPRSEMFRIGGLTQFMSREWLPGFEETFKRLNREWFTGRSADSLLEELESLHRSMVAVKSGGI